MVCLFALKLNAILQLEVLSLKVWEQAVVSISAGFGQFLWYEEGEGALYRGRFCPDMAF